jgi:hypothetical protein
MMRQKISWEAACRWQQYDAEMRVNLVRIAAIGLFYSVHLVHQLASKGNIPVLTAIGLDLGTVVSKQTHVAITCVMLAWLMIGVLIHLLLRGQVFPDWLMYASTAADICFLTAILVLTSGPTSSLISGYFLIVIMSGLRFDLTLVRCTTFAAFLSYLFVLGCAKWPIGLSKLNALPTLPRYQQFMMIIALLLAGVLVGQGVRQARRLAIGSAPNSDDEMAI